MENTVGVPAAGGCAAPDGSASRNLRVLIVDDPPNSEALQRTLREGGLRFTARQVDQWPAFLESVESFEPDIVLATYALPGLDGRKALDHVRRTRPELPVAMVTEPLGEETAIELLKAGAKDYVLKSNLRRLVPSVQRAISVEQGIRARKSAERALRAANAMLATTERLGHIGGFDWDIVGDRMAWSDEHFRIFGYAPGDFEPSVARFCECVHADDRERARQAFASSLAGGQPLDIEFRVVRPDRTERIVHSLAEVVRDRTGMPLRMSGTSRDITEQKRAEEFLRASEARFRLLVEQAPDAIVIHDLGRNHFIEANRAAERLFGCGREEIVRHGPLHFYAAEQPDAQPVSVSFAEHSRRVLADGHLTFERRIRNAQGQERLCEVTLVRLPSVNDQLLRASFVDITERREAERRWRASLQATVGAIASTVEMRDRYTAGHQQRVAQLSVAIARELNLGEDDIEGLHLAATIHDVGKITIPSDILNKPGRLSGAELGLIREHAQSGYDIVKGVDFPWPIAQIILQHHERLDGSGYPQGLKGDAILREAKILAVADVVEAMMTHRPYRPALGVDAALEEIGNSRGRLFDPDAVDACLRLFRERGFVFR
jgi:PAS domain S-box-containing protein